MDGQRKRFTEGILEKLGGNPSTAKELFDQIEKFASYAFPKAHAAAYALITYQTAYLKAHYPVEYLAALMTHELHNTDKLTFFAREVKRLKFSLLPPDVNESQAHFKVEDGAIRYALAALKNVGFAAMSALTQERENNGIYKDIFDFIERVDGRVINKRQMENLIASGAFDSIFPNRRCLMNNLDLLLKYGNEDKRPQGLFGVDVTRPTLHKCEDWPPLEKLRYEFQAVGFYLTSHPLDSYAESLQDVGILPASERLARAQEKSETQVFRLAGIVITKQEKSTKTGQRYAFVQFSDSSGVFEVTVFSELLSQYREKLIPGAPLVITVSSQTSESTLRLTCQDIESLEKAVDGGVFNLTLQSKEQISSLYRLLSHTEKGNTKIHIKVKVGNTLATFCLPSTYTLSPDLRAALTPFSKAA